MTPTPISRRMWPEPVERVSAYIRAVAVDATLQEFPEGTKTVAEAATAIGCEPGLIVKSLVFVCGDEAVLALVPGDRRCDEGKVAAAVGSDGARLASLDEVREATGQEPGAVAPFPQPALARTLLDHTLLGHGKVWIGGGSSRHMVAIAPGDLVRLTQATTADLVTPR